ncbi:MAG: tyrosine recombinase [Dehalococcoidia bacterium]|nr:tyrosine recombinase [Dehalococcoidia bacterium]
MDSLLDSYRQHLQGRNLSPYTIRNYLSDLSHFLQFLQEEALSLQTLSRQAFRHYLARLSQDGVAPASIARKVSTIRTFLRFLVQEGHLEHDPLSGVRGPKRPRRLPAYLSPEQVTALIEAASGASPGELRDRALLELLYACGLRVSEVTGLDVGDVDLLEGIARVRGKGGKERLVLMGRPAVQALRRYLRDGRPALLRQPYQQALFLNMRDGQRLSARSVQAIVRRYAQRAGIDRRVWPHLLRHTFATHMLDGGADLRVVQELLGHTSPTSTQIYMHVTQEHQRRRYLEAFYHQIHRPREG